MKARRFYGLAVLLALAACAQSPTEAVGPSAPLLDGGLTYGGGNAAETPGTPPAPASDGGLTYGGGNAAETSGCEDGGLTYGGGNHTSPASCSP